jgi:hypothetical protein
MKPHPSPEEMSQVATIAMCGARALLRTTGEVLPIVHLINDNQKLGKLMTCPAEYMNDDRKYAFWRTVRKTVAEDHCQMIVSISDTWQLDTDNEEAVLAAQQAAAPRYLRIADLVALGLGRRVEAVFVIVETPLAQYSIAQHYERTPEGIVFGKEVVTEGDSNRIYGECTAFHTKVPTLSQFQNEVNQ